jgi:quercetin dioxygenase-like cupin family protein
MKEKIMKIVSIEADSTGETFFNVVDVPDEETAFGPPPNPTGLKSDFGNVDGMFAFSVPAGINVPAHNAPQPYISIVLSGEAEISTSDGAKRTFGPGEVLFCNDLEGKGHVTRAISDFVAVFINRVV